MRSPAISAIRVFPRTFLGLVAVAIVGLVAAVLAYQMGGRGGGRTEGRALKAADNGIGGPDPNLEQRLDEALMETFPASDPIAIHIE